MPSLDNHRAWTVIESLLSRVDRERFRGAGDPLPAPGPLTVYRGVGGRGPACRISGYRSRVASDAMLPGSPSSGNRV